MTTEIAAIRDAILAGAPGEEIGALPIPATVRGALVKADEQEMFELILAECVEGVDRRNYLGPRILRSTVKAGALKVADYYNRIEPNMLKCIRVVGRVHAVSGMTLEAVDSTTPLGSLCKVSSFGGHKQR